LAGTYSGGTYISNVKVTLSASDASSGVKHTYYNLDSSGYVTYGGPFTVSALGNHTLLFYSVDVAGNAESPHSHPFPIESVTTTKLTPSVNPAPYGAPITFTAIVTPASGSAATGTVNFTDDGHTLLDSGTLNGGEVQYTTVLSAGLHTIDAYYTGSTTDQPSLSYEEVTVYGSPAPVSLSPSSGAGLTQTFTAVYYDPAGAGDLNNVQMLINTAINGANACYVFYYPATNALYLENDGDTAELGPLTPGSSSSISNSQCTLAGNGSSVNESGDYLTVNFALTFASTFTESKLVSLEANNAYAGSAWSPLGTWTPASIGPPTVTSLTPTSGTGLSQTFTVVYSDPNGTPDLSKVSILFNTTLSSVNGCYVFYYPETDALYLENDAGTGTIGPITSGSSSSIANNQCTLSGMGSGNVRTGDNLTAYYAITFANSYVGLKNVYLEATSFGGASSGWVEEGTWTPSAAYLGPPTVVSVTPASGTGFTQTFSAVYSDPYGTSDLNNVRLLLNPSLNGVNGCEAFYYPRTNEMFLEADGDNGVFGPLTPGSSSSISNSQCTLSGAGSSVTKSGNNLTVNFALSFATTYTGSKNVYLEANSAGDSSTGPSSGWVEKGTWSVSPAPPIVVSVTPASGTGSTQTFSAVYSDPNPNEIDFMNNVRLLLNPAINGVDGCYVFYYPRTYEMFLGNDEDNGVIGPLTPGSSSSISNSQCTLSGEGSSALEVGGTLTVHFALSFASTYTGSKNIYLEANSAGDSSAGLSSGWVEMGTWTP
jgi:hypothetical protein